jgi:hypothetical protein
MTIRGLTRSEQQTLDYLAATFVITAIVPLFYVGTNAGSEFLTYAATKLYFCKSLTISSNGVNSTVTNYWVFHNGADATMFMMSANNHFYNAGTAAVNYGVNYIHYDNFWFSRIIESGGADYMRFVGYRITRT